MTVEDDPNLKADATIRNLTEELQTREHKIVQVSSGMRIRKVTTRWCVSRFRWRTWPVPGL
ncbi:MAG: hypothetical protein ABEL51_12835 [Salinibacter sp.]